MWQTIDGDRVLEGKERSLYASAILAAVESLTDERQDIPTLGVKPFDSFLPQQKMAAWLYVFRSMTDPSIEAPELTGVLEGVAFTPFAYLNYLVELEINYHISCNEDSTADENKPGTYWRRQILEAYIEIYPDEDEDDQEGSEPRITVGSLDLDEWISVVDQIANAISDDRDWELPSLGFFQDSSPSAKTNVMESLGQEPGYLESYPWQFLETSLTDIETVLKAELTAVCP